MCKIVQPLHRLEPTGKAGIIPDKTFTTNQLHTFEDHPSQAPGFGGRSAISSVHERGRKAYEFDPLVSLFSTQRPMPLLQRERHLWLPFLSFPPIASFKLWPQKWGRFFWEVLRRENPLAQPSWPAGHKSGSWCTLENNQKHESRGGGQSEGKRW
jgi:hypothetical protein